MSLGSEMDVKVNQQGKPLGQGKELFLDILTKEEKEALLTAKIEEIRRKNEARARRHEEIEADKKKAEALAQKDAALHHEEDESLRNYNFRKTKRQSGDFASKRTSGEFGTSKRESGDHRPNRASGDFSKRHSGEFSERRDHNQHRDNKRDSGDFVERRDRREFNRENNDPRGVAPDDRQPEKRGGKLAAGRGKRLANMTQEKLKAKEYEKRKQLPPSSPQRPSARQPTQDSPDGPPPDPKFNFLADRSREGPAPGPGREKEGRRHPRNFGGGEQFSNVAQKVKGDKERQGRNKGAPRSKMEMAMQMTGRERLQYMEWKEERERIDQARIERQKDATGEWRREWDHDKVQQDFDEKRIEPGKRPAGRIGSGRFDRGERGERSERGRGDNIGRGRGSGRTPGHSGSLGEKGQGSSISTGEKADKTRAPRPRVTSTGSDDRSVETQNDSLLIKIDNEFASPKRSSPTKTSPKGNSETRQRGKGRNPNSPRGEEQKHWRPPRQRSPQKKPAREDKVTDVKNKQEQTEEIPDAEAIMKTVRETPERNVSQALKTDADGFIEDDYHLDHREYHNLASPEFAGKVIAEHWPEMEGDAKFYDVPSDPNDSEELENLELQKKSSIEEQKNEEKYSDNYEEEDEGRYEEGEDAEEGDFYGDGEEEGVNVSAEGVNVSAQCEQVDTSAELQNISDTSLKQDETGDPKSPLSDMKTPTDLVHVLDWGAEMSDASKSGQSSTENSPRNEADKKGKTGETDEVLIVDVDKNHVSTESESPEVLRTADTSTELDGGLDNTPAVSLEPHRSDLTDSSVAADDNPVNDSAKDVISSVSPTEAEVTSLPPVTDKSEKGANSLADELAQVAEQSLSDEISAVSKPDHVEERESCLVSDVAEACEVTANSEDSSKESGAIDMSVHDSSEKSLADELAQVSEQSLADEISTASKQDGEDGELSSASTPEQSPIKILSEHTPAEKGLESTAEEKEKEIVEEPKQDDS